MAVRPVRRRGSSAEHVAHVLGADPTVAVPRSPTVVESHSVHHAVTQEPVIRLLIYGSGRIRPVAQVTAGEFRGNRARHAQIGDGDLFVYRCEIVGEIWIR